MAAPFVERCLMTTKNEWTGPEFAPIFYRAMAEWHEGGCVGKSPKTNWQCRHTSGYEQSSTDTPEFCRTVIYFWKPAPKRTIIIGYRRENDVWQSKKLVAPEVEAPEIGTPVYMIQPAIGLWTWGLGEWWNIRLAEGRVFLTSEDAKAMADWQAVCRRGGV